MRREAETSHAVGGARVTDPGCSTRAGDLVDPARATCDVCPRACSMVPGATGACRARSNLGGAVVPSGYGRITSLAMDPVEKKPLACWRPGSLVLSVGGYGCNLRCAWCQNHGISQVGETGVAWRELPPEALVELAAQARGEDRRVAGIAHTYNEPLVCWEYVRDAGRLAHEAGLANVLVTAGCVSEHVVRELAPLVDAVNVDLKAFRAETYRALGGDLACVRNAIRAFAAEPACHVEVTTLVVPGVNDTVEEIDELAEWLATVGSDIVLHVTRFFPRWRMLDRGPTPVGRVYDLADVARAHLPQVFTGNC